MRYSTDLERRIDAVTGGVPLVKKKMFGGICYLAHGNMCFGIYQDYLIVRLGSAAAAAPLLQSPHVRPMDVTGKPMKGWVMVAPPAWLEEQALRQWLARGREFAASLPPK